MNDYILFDKIVNIELIAADIVTKSPKAVFVKDITSLVTNIKEVGGASSKTLVVAAIGSDKRPHSFSFYSEKKLVGWRVTLSDESITKGYKVVKENGKWNVYYMTEEIQQGDTSLVITCPDSGMKPEIYISNKLLPGYICYHTIVKITNLMSSFDIRKYTTIRITAGYRSGYTQTFTCPIFSCYVESPNPDGVTVFNCLCTGLVDAIFSDKQIEVVFHQGKVTIGELIRECVHKVGNGIEPIMNGLTPFLEDEITLIERTCVASNGYAVIMWLQDQLYAWGKNVSEDKGGPYTVNTLIDNGKISITAYKSNNGLFSWCTSQEEVIDLNLISTAAFNGGTVSVKAPWNPKLVPGGLFKMSPRFYNAEHLINQLPESSWTGTDDIYRVITLDLEFSTTGTNSMVIMGVPVQYTDNEASIKSNAVKSENMSEQVKIAKERITIEIGKKEKEDIPNTDLWSITPSFISTSFEDGTLYRIQPGDTLSNLSAKFYSSISPYTKTAEELNNLQVIGSKLVEDTWVNPSYGSSWLWPVIVVATNALVQSGKNNNMHFCVNKQDPDSLVVGQYLYIPKISTFQSLENNKDAIDIYRLMGILYANKGKPAYSSALKNISIYLKGGE